MPYLANDLGIWVDQQAWTYIYSFDAAESNSSQDDKLSAHDQPHQEVIFT